MAELLRQEKGLRAQLDEQRESLAWTNGLLAKRSAEMVDLSGCCSNLKAELVIAQGGSHLPGRENTRVGGWARSSKHRSRCPKG
jgi:uncharacterized protein YbaP (TraB family)